MRSVLGAWALGLLAIAAACAMLTGCHSPVAADPLTHLVYTGPALAKVTAEDTAWGEAEFEWQSACVGFTNHLSEPITIEVLSGGFLCPVGGQGIYAAGCTTMAKIQVAYPYFKGALSHELIHYLTMKMGWPVDAAHQGAIWAKCDHLNR